MSVHADILEWATTELESAGVVTPTSVKRRTRPAWLKGDPDPILLISTEGFNEELVGRQTADANGNVATLAFPVYVCYATQKAFQYRDPCDLANIRALIRGALLKLRSIPNVRLSGYIAMPVVSMVGFPDGWDVVPQLFVYHGNELITET